MSTKNEGEWFRKFYEGTFLVKGWKHRMKEVLQVVPEADKKEIEARLEELGKIIGREWAKDNNVRKIDTDMLKKWGSGLQKAGTEGYAVLADEIIKIKAEVNGIMSA